jgi:hypothetical protein
MSPLDPVTRMPVDEQKKKCKIHLGYDVFSLFPGRCSQSNRFGGLDTREIWRSSPVPSLARGS